MTDQSTRAREVLRREHDAEFGPGIILIEPAEWIVRAMLAFSAQEGGNDTGREPYPGLPMSDDDLTQHYEAAKRDVVSLVGSEVRQIIGELRHYRSATLNPSDTTGREGVVIPEGMAEIAERAFRKGWQARSDYGTDRDDYQEMIEPELAAYRRIIAYTPASAQSGECPASGLPSGEHQVDTSMESGPNNCFFCEQPMGTALATQST